MSTERGGADSEALLAIARSLVEGWGAVGATDTDMTLGQRGERPNLTRFVSIIALCGHTHWAVDKAALSNKGEVCLVDGCERPRRAKGWCEMHWQRWRATGDPGPVEAKRVSSYDGQACAVEGCEAEAVSGGLCNAHYLRFRKHGDPLAGKPSPSVRKVVDHPDGTRTCTTCGERKLLDQFGVDKNPTGGRRSQCKPCRSGIVRDWYAENRERQRGRQRARYAADVETIRQRDRERYERDREKRIAGCLHRR